MSAPAIALITLGSAAYLLIGCWAGISLGTLFALGGEPDSAWLLLLRIILVVAVVFLWAPAAIMFLIIALILAPFGLG